MIIETSTNQFFRVWDTNQEGLDHVWYGEPVRKLRAGGWSRVGADRGPQLVRKAATKVVEA
jgi:predicted double-glycine peptidase